MSLKPCPFCGSPAELIPGSGAFKDTIEATLESPKSVRCSSGSCGARYCPGGFGQEEWNNRAPVAEEKTPTWISVKDRMPEDWQQVLVWQQGRARIGLGRTMSRSDGRIWEFNGTSAHESVGPEFMWTHWQELPSGPHG